MPLTDTAIRAAKPLDKPQKLFDGNGLFLFVSTHGTKSWRVKYTFQGREKLLTLGTYPELSLKEAREGCAAAKKRLAAGTDPSAEKNSKPEVSRRLSRLSHANGMPISPPYGRKITPKM